MRARLVTSLALLLVGFSASAEALKVPNPFAERSSAFKALNRARPLQCKLDDADVTAATTESLQILVGLIKQDLASKNILITKVEWPPAAEILYDAGAKSLATLTHVQLVTGEGRRFVLRTKGLGADGVWTPVNITETGANTTCAVSTVGTVEVRPGRLEEESRRFETEVVDQQSGDTVTSSVYNRFQFVERDPGPQTEQVNAQRFCIIDFNCPFEMMEHH